MSVKARALAFLQDGKQSFYHRVSRKPQVPRPFMAPSLEEFAPTVVSELNSAIEKVIEGGD